MDVVGRVIPHMYEYSVLDVPKGHGEEHILRHAMYSGNLLQRQAFVRKFLGYVSRTFADPKFWELLF